MLRLLVTIGWPRVGGPQCTPGLDARQRMPTGSEKAWRSAQGDRGPSRLTRLADLVDRGLGVPLLPQA
jgi:hypothetical protein